MQRKLAGEVRSEHCYTVSQVWLTCVLSRVPLLWVAGLEKGGGTFEAVRRGACQGGCTYIFSNCSIEVQNIKHRSMRQQHPTKYRGSSASTARTNYTDAQSKQIRNVQAYQDTRRNMTSQQSRMMHDSVANEQSRHNP